MTRIDAAYALFLFSLSSAAITLYAVLLMLAE